MNQKYKVYIAKKFTSSECCDKYGRFAWGFNNLCDFHNKRCAKCGVTRMEHEDNGDHPHFETNLIMLEYYSERKEIKVA